MALPLALSLLGNLIVALFILVCAALILIVLIQKGRGGGLGAAFGGGGAGSLLGTKTGDFLTWVTIGLVAGFLVLAVLMGKFMRPSGTSSSLAAPVAPVESAAPETEPAADETAPVTESQGEVVGEAAETAAEMTEQAAGTVEEAVESVPDGTEPAQPDVPAEAAEPSN